MSTPHEHGSVSQPSCFEFEVAISYARQDRLHAQALADRLEHEGMRVFLDVNRAAAEWGQPLAERLEDIYLVRSRLVVVLVSSHYGMRPWTMHERDAIERRLQTEPDAVLPIRLGGAMLSGLLARLAYMELAAGIEPIVDALRARLGTTTTIASPPLEGSTAMNRNPRFQHHSPVTSATSHHAVAHGNAKISTKIGGNKSGIGAFGLVSILAVVGLIVGSLVWVFVDFVRHLPRNEDGRVVVLGVPVPEALVGDSPAAEVVEAPEDPEGSSAEAVDERPPAPTVPTAAAHPSPDALAGLWQCRGEGGTNSARVMLSQSGRATIRDWYATRNNFSAPFSEWTGAPYEFTSPETIVVGKEEAHIELNRDGSRMLLMGGLYHFDCERQEMDQPETTGE